MEQLLITRPDDWHIHLRDGDLLATTVDDASRCFRRAVVMPNLVPPVTDAAQARAYRKRILEALPPGRDFEPLMTLYLTDNTSPAAIAEAANDPTIRACKLYPAGATTNSDSGVTSLERIYPALETMQAKGLLLLVHGEVTDNDVDIFDRERVFIDTRLRRIVNDFPTLKVVLEHITTADAVDFIGSAPATVAATITAHHLLYNRNHMLAGGVRPHFYCLPILKRSLHQQALIAAATSGEPRFFLGTDSAPHARHTKEAACGCAGCYTAPHAMELYAEAFERADALHRLEAFASHFGPDFYGLPRNTGKLRLLRQARVLPGSISWSAGELVPLRAGETLPWSAQQA